MLRTVVAGMAVVLQGTIVPPITTCSTPTQGRGRENAGKEAKIQLPKPRPSGAE